MLRLTAILKRRSNFLKIKLIFAFFLFLIPASYAQQMIFHLLPQATSDYVWTGQGADQLWTTPENWSTKLVPSSSDVAIFNNQCVPYNCNATVNIPASVAGLHLNSNYSGTLTVDSGQSLNVGLKSLIQESGTIIYNTTANQVITGDLLVSGGSYQATSGTLEVHKNVLFSGASIFNANSGTVSLQLNSPTARNISIGSREFNRFNIVGSSSAASLTVTGTVAVNDQFLCRSDSAAGPMINSGDVSAKGNLTFENFGCIGSTLIKVSGSAGQTLSGQSSDTRVPSIAFESSGGLVELLGHLVFSGSLTYVSGTVQGSTSTAYFPFSSGTNQNLNPGSVEFGNVIISGTGTSSTKTLSSAMNIGGNLQCASTGGLGQVNGSALQVKGNMTFSGLGCGGTSTFVMNGATGTQTLTGGVGIAIPSYQIQSTGSTVQLSGVLEFNQNFTYTSGGVLASGSQVSFIYSPSTTHTITSTDALELDSVTFKGNGTSSIKNIAGTLVIAGAMTCNTTTMRGKVNSGLIRLRGDVSFLGFGCEGPTEMIVDGSGIQNISGISNAFIPKFEIASTGVVNLSGTLDFSSDFVYTSGTVNAGSSTAYFRFISYQSLAISLAPGIEFNNVSTGSSAYTPVRILTGNMIVRGNLDAGSATHTGVVNGGTIQVYGNVRFSGGGIGGTTQILMLGSNSATLHQLTATIPSTEFVINKPGATVSLTSNYDIEHMSPLDLSIINGTVNLSGFLLRGVGTLTVSAGSQLICNGGMFSVASLVADGTIDCPGFASYAFHWTGAGGDSNWNNSANWSGNAVPNSTQMAAFSNAFCGSQCDAVVNVNPNVKGVVLLSDYTGTITQGTGVSVTIGTSGWVQKNGFFIGSDSPITISNYFQIEAGQFQSTSGLFRLLASVYAQNVLKVAGPGQFSHNSGSISLENGTTGYSKVYDFGGAIMNNLSVQGSAILSWPQASDVLGNLSINVDAYGARLAGTFNLYGNLTILNHEHHTSTVIRFVGTNNQTVTTSGAVDSETSRIGRVIFDKPSGSVTFNNHHSIAGLEYLQAGSVSIPAGITTSIWWYDLPSIYTADTITPGPIDFQNVRFVDDSSRNIIGTLKVLGDLFINLGAHGANLSGGKIQVSRNLNLVNDSTGTAVLGTEIELIGNSISSVTLNAGEAFPGHLTISKTSPGAVNLASAAIVRNGEADVRVNSGVLNMAGFALTIGNASGTNNILQLESGTVLNRGGGALVYENLVNNGGTINP